MAKPYYQDAAVTLYHGDCREILPQLRCPNTTYCLEACDGRCEGISLVVADPPYTFGMASSAQEGKAGSWGDMMNGAFWYSVWLKECFLLTQNKQGAAWVFNSWRSFPVLARAAYEARWPIESLLVWDKQWIGPGGSQGLRPSYELVALFAHDGFALANRGLPDIWQSQWSSQKPHGHPAEKPVDLIQRIIAESGPGHVLDPFAGSGTTLRAAKDLGRRAIGIEIEERYCEIAARRLAQEVLPL